MAEDDGVNYEKTARKSEKGACFGAQNVLNVQKI